MTKPGGGSSIGGHFTPGPRYATASRCSNSGHPPSVTLARPCSTKWYGSPSSLFSPGTIDIEIRGSRRRFRIFCCSKRCPDTTSSPSRPTQTQATCGLPSGLIVTMWARWPPARAARTLADISALMTGRPPCLTGCRYGSRRREPGRDRLERRLGRVAGEAVEQVPPGEGDQLQRLLFGQVGTQPLPGPVAEGGGVDQLVARPQYGPVPLVVPRRVVRRTLDGGDPLLRREAGGLAEHRLVYAPLVLAAGAGTGTGHDQLPYPDLVDRALRRVEEEPRQRTHRLREVGMVAQEHAYGVQRFDLDVGWRPLGYAFGVDTLVRRVQHVQPHRLPFLLTGPDPRPPARPGGTCDGWAAMTRWRGAAPGPPAAPAGAPPGPAAGAPPPRPARAARRPPPAGPAPPPR